MLSSQARSSTAVGQEQSQLCHTSPAHIPARAAAGPCDSEPYEQVYPSLAPPTNRCRQKGMLGLQQLLLNNNVLFVRI